MTKLARLCLAAFLVGELLGAETSTFAAAVRKAADYSRRGQQQEARKAAAEALAMLQSGSGPPDFQTAAGLNDLAALAYAQGDLTRAEQLFERSRRAYDALIAQDDLRLASVLFNLAGIYVEQGKYPQAEPLYRQSLAIREKLRGAADPLVAEVFNDLGFLFLQQQKYKEAQSWLERALAIWENSAGTDLAYAAIALNNLALLHRREGRLDAAESSYRRALEVEEKVFGGDHPELATTWMNLAALYRARGARENAATAYRRALATLEKSLGAQDPLAVETRDRLRELEGGEYLILVVRERAEAEELRARIERGGDFSDLAKRYSIDTSAASGGHFRASSAELRKELRAAIERLRTGQVSAVFALGANWAMVKKISE